MIKVYSSMERHTSYDISNDDMQSALRNLIKNELIDESSIINIQNHKDGVWLTTVIFARDTNENHDRRNGPDL